jgi:hypothetical protein
MPRHGLAAALATPRSGRADDAAGRALLHEEATLRQLVDVRPELLVELRDRGRQLLLLAAVRLPGQSFWRAELASGDHDRRPRLALGFGRLAAEFPDAIFWAHFLSWRRRWGGEVAQLHHEVMQGHRAN